jgi:hypothetical protein
MYSTEREIYYKKLLSIYSRYIPQDMIKAIYNNQVVYIDTDNRRGYDKDGNVVIKFVH